MTVFPLAILFLIAVSAIADPKKTWAGLKKGMTMFLNILPTFLTVISLVAVVLYFLPPALIERYLGAGSGFKGLALAAGIGSIALMPGFIAYPLAAVLRDQGASMMTIAAFITTLLMVGVVTLPVEIEFMGLKASLWRNLLSFLGALVVALLMGVCYAWLP